MKETGGRTKLWPVPCAVLLISGYRGTGSHTADMCARRQAVLVGVGAPNFCGQTIRVPADMRSARVC